MAAAPGLHALLRAIECPGCPSNHADLTNLLNLDLLDPARPGARDIAAAPTAAAEFGRWLCSAELKAGGDQITEAESQLLYSTVRGGHSGLYSPAASADERADPGGTAELAASLADLEGGNAGAEHRLGQLRFQCDQQRAAATACRERGALLQHSAMADAAVSEDGRVALRHRDRQLDRAMADGHAAAEALAKVHTAGAVQHGDDRCDSASQPCFASHCSEAMQAWIRSEESYTEALAKYAKKQFQDGFMVISSPDSDAAQYQWVELDDPGSFIVRGHSIEQYSASTHELLRLNALDEIANMQSFEATLAKISLEAGIACAEQTLARLRHGGNGWMDESYTAADDAEARAEHHGAMVEELVAEFAAAKEQLRLRCAHAATAQHSCVLRGDYDLKLVRQNYTTKCQDTLLEFLKLQRARQEFVALQLAVEENVHLEHHNLLDAFATHLDNTQQATDYRVGGLQAAKAAPRSSRMTVPLADTTFLSIDTVLAPVDADPNRQVQYDQVYGQLSYVRGKLDSTRAHRDNREERQREELATRESQLKHCIRVLYKTDSPDLGTLPHLAPSIVESNLRLLHGNLDALTRAIKLLDTQIKAHTSALATDPVKRREAALMETFYMKPQEL